jgi:hypothetical protein
MPDSNKANLITKLDESHGEILCANGIYPFLDYGWDGPDEYSTEYVGIAMYFTDPPFELDLPFSEHPPASPSEADEAYHLAYEDFVGAMDVARTMLGIAFYCYENRKPAPILDDEEAFWLYVGNTSLWLNIASDRIRDFLVMARFGVPFETYKGQDRNNREYSQPFSDHPESGKAVESASKQLLVPAQCVQKFRKKRNGIVHKIASRRASNAMKMLQYQKDAASSKRASSVVHSSALSVPASGGEKWVAAFDGMVEEKWKEMESELNELKDWYLQLVTLASVVFEYEYWKRRELNTPKL